ncbi:MAG: McrC family protein [Syntrophales bacterium]
MSPQVYSLREYEPTPFTKEQLPEESVRALHASYRNQVVVERPLFTEKYNWTVTPQGWVGYIPLSDDVHLSLVPKVPVGNIFGMLEYAYQLDFQILEGLVDSKSVAELYDRLAFILARKVLDRIRKGLYRSYVADCDQLPYVRGRMDIQAHLRVPAQIHMPCHFEEHTSDLEENQILLWTFTRLLASGTCTERSLPYIRQARRILQGFVTGVPVSAERCVNRLYNRLNNDYEPLHALCRFFLEHTGPSHLPGDRKMLPILVNMERLFELFVFQWLKRHVSDRYIVHGQETVQFEMKQKVSIRIDITIEDLQTGRTCFVLDTKYKAPDTPALADIHQVVAYAVAKDCDQAVLIYPSPLERDISGLFGDIHVQSRAFRIDGDLESGGSALLGQLSLS